MLEMCANVAKTCRLARQMLISRNRTYVSIGATLFSIDRVIALWEALRPGDVAGTSALRDSRADICRVPDIHNLGGLSAAEVRKRSQPSWVDWFAGVTTDYLLRRHAIRYLSLLSTPQRSLCGHRCPTATSSRSWWPSCWCPDLSGSLERLVAFSAAVASGAVVGTVLAGLTGNVPIVLIVLTTALIFLGHRVRADDLVGVPRGADRVHDLRHRAAAATQLGDGRVVDGGRPHRRRDRPGRDVSRPGRAELCRWCGDLRPLPGRLG